MDFLSYRNMSMEMKGMMAQEEDCSLMSTYQMFQQAIQAPLPSLEKQQTIAAEQGSIYYCDNSSGSDNTNRHPSDDDDDGHDSNDLRRGPWTVEEDLLLVNYITEHGEGRWNSLARLAGLKRTGKSCRLRWLNYLRPDVRRGNITPQEQLLILELHSRWGNRWSKIAQYLPGRTDNEIKNYWRTRVQKHARQLKCDVNSQKFKDVVRQLWMPRLMERIQAAGNTSTPAPLDATPELSFQQLPRTQQQQQPELAGAGDFSCMASGSSQVSLARSNSTGSGVTSCSNSVLTATGTVCPDLSSPTPPSSDFSTAATDAVEVCGWYGQDVFPTTASVQIGSGYPCQPEGLPSPGSYSYYYNQGLTELDGMCYESSNTWTAASNDWSDNFWAAALDVEDAGIWSSPQGLQF